MENSSSYAKLRCMRKKVKWSIKEFEVKQKIKLLKPALNATPHPYYPFLSVKPPASSPHQRHRIVRPSIRTARLPPASPSRGDRGRAKTAAAPPPDVATSRRSTCPLYRYSATTMGRSAQLTCLPRSVDGRNSQLRHVGPGHGQCPSHARQSLCKHRIFADISASSLHCATQLHLTCTQNLKQQQSTCNTL